MHFNTQAYTYETSWSSAKSRKIELQSYLMYIKDYLKKHKSYAQAQSQAEYRVQMQTAFPNNNF